jgi:hypothetical protein
MRIKDAMSAQTAFFVRVPRLRGAMWKGGGPFAKKIVRLQSI